MSTEVSTWVVDRFEAETAVLVSDEGESVTVDRAALPGAARAGSVLRVRHGPDGAPMWDEAVVDDEATRKRRAEAEELLGELRKRDPGGDVVL